MGRRGCSPCNTYQPDVQQGGYGQCGDNSAYYPSNSDQMAYNNSCRTRGRYGDAGGGDNFVIVPEANSFGSQEHYDAAVKGACKYTDQNYDQALKDAAAKGQPVVAVFGSKNTPDTQKLLATVAAAQKNGAEGATYVYIDMDRVAQNPNSNLAKFVNQNVRGHNLAHTMLFAQRPDAAGNPIPEAPMMTAWGGRDQIQGLLRDHVKYGQDAMRGRQFNVKESDAAVAPKADAVDQTPAKKKNQELLKDIDSGLEAGKKSTDWREGEKHFLKAIRAADQVDQNAVKADLAKLEEAKKAATVKNDANQVKELQTQIDQLQRLQDAAWKTRMEFGFKCMKWNPNYKNIGEQWLMSAGDRNPNMYMDQQFRNRLREAGYTPQAENAFAGRVAQHELNKIGPIGPNQQRDVGPDGKPRQTPADKVNPPLQTDRQNLPDGRPPIRPDVRPPLRPEPGTQPEVKPEVKPTVRPEVKPEQRRERVPHPEIPNVIKIDSGSNTAAEYDALAKAADEGIPLKTGWGTPDCRYCPRQLANFENNGARNRDAVYFSHHDRDSSSLASQIGADSGSVPSFRNYTVQRVSENEFRVTPQGSRNGSGYTVRFNSRRRAS